MEKYSAKYFYAKFEAIPEEKWAVGPFNINGATCALGHLGRFSIYLGPEEEAMKDLFCPDGTERERYPAVYEINDGLGKYKKLGETPKQRILNALRAKMFQPAALK